MSDRVGKKDDGGKPRWTLLPFDALQQVVNVLEYGARKYAPNGWLLVENGRQRYSDALLRHFSDWLMGEEADHESGLHHLAHVATNALFLLALEIKREQ